MIFLLNWAILIQITPLKWRAMRHKENLPEKKSEKAKGKGLLLSLKIDPKANGTPAIRGRFAKVTYGIQNVGCRCRICNSKKVTFFKRVFSAISVAV